MAFAMVSEPAIALHHMSEKTVVSKTAWTTAHSVDFVLKNIRLVGVCATLGTSVKYVSSKIVSTTAHILMETVTRLLESVHAIWCFPLTITLDPITRGMVRIALICSLMLVMSGLVCNRPLLLPSLCLSLFYFSPGMVIFVWFPRIFLDSERYNDDLTNMMRISEVINCIGKVLNYPECDLLSFRIMPYLL